MAFFVFLFSLDLCMELIPTPSSSSSSVCLFATTPGVLIRWEPVSTIPENWRRLGGGLITSTRPGKTSGISRRGLLESCCRAYRVSGHVVVGGWMESPPLFPLYLVFFLNIDLISLLLHNFQSKNEEFLGIWIWNLECCCSCCWLSW